MLHTKKIYTIICDNCDSDFSQEDEYINQYEDQEIMSDIATDDGWIEIDKKHYCPHCYSIDDYDDIQIKLL